MILTAAHIQSGTSCTPERAAYWLDPLKISCALFHIDTPARLAAFLAQTGHESARLSVVTESLNYSAAGLLATWPSRFTPATAAELARQPERIANHVYGGRMGNGDKASGEGWKYRGRGLIQLTGRANYRAARDGLRALLQIVPDFEAMPELLEQPEVAALTAGWYWHDRRLNELADIGDMAGLTRKINGGTNGLAERLELYRAGLRALA